MGTRDTDMPPLPRAQNHRDLVCIRLGRSSSLGSKLDFNAFSKRCSFWISISSEARRYTVEKPLCDLCFPTVYCRASDSFMVKSHEQKRDYSDLGFVHYVIQKGTISRIIL